MPNQIREALDKTMTEQQLQDRVAAEAHQHGWMVAHFRPARTATGWRTAVAYDGAGFPDLILARNGVVVFIELKTETGRLSRTQQAWQDHIGDYHVIRPRDLHDRLEELLR